MSSAPWKSRSTIHATSSLLDDSSSMSSLPSFLLYSGEEEAEIVVLLQEHNWIHRRCSVLLEYESNSNLFSEASIMSLRIPSCSSISKTRDPCKYCGCCLKTSSIVLLVRCEPSTLAVSRLSSLVSCSSVSLRHSASGNAGWFPIFSSVRLVLYCTVWNDIVILQ